MLKRKSYNRLRPLVKLVIQRWLRVDSRSPPSKSIELVTACILQEVAAKVVKVAVAEEEAVIAVEVVIAEEVVIAVAAEEEAVLPELMSKENKSTMPQRKKVVDSKESQEVSIPSTSNPVPVEVLESLLRKRKVMVAVTGAISQIKLTREVRPKRELQKVTHQRANQHQHQLLLRLRKKRRQILSRKKLSSELVLTIS